jgi:hypothetical protein
LNPKQKRRRTQRRKSQREMREKVKKDDDWRKKDARQRESFGIVCFEKGDFVWEALEFNLRFGRTLT